MAYDPQTWANGQAGGTPLSAARLTHMETGIDNAHVTADAAIPAPASPSASDVLIWNGSSWTKGKVANANVDSAAAIAYSKLNLAGAILNADVSASAAIAVSKLAGGSDGQVLTTSGSTPTWAAAPGATVYRKVTEKDVVNTTTETDLLNGEITVAAGAMSTNKMLRATLLGDYLNNTGGTLTTTLRVKLGGTNLYVDNFGAIGQDPGTRAWRLLVEITNLNSASSQFTVVSFFLGTETAPTTGVSRLSATPVRASVGASSGATAVNTGSSAAFVVTAQHGTASASASMKLRSAIVEIV